MTAATQRKTLEYVLMVVGAVATMFFSLGFARHELDGKEDAAAHDHDMATLRAEISIRTVRDSAERADVRRILVDVSCQLNPSRGYCGRSQP